MRQLARPGVRRHIQLYETDWNYLMTYAQQGLVPGAIGPSATVREIVHTWCKAHKAKTDQLIAARGLKNV